ncbi:mucin-binding protein [Fructobacillus parabroussonetiae]|uniref:Mub B2-like domain-containing protein n=1 Tax=Fructobacillus parabroussonetiae TaxID=2713174 RepID=A0ABS5QXH2_9LACO|nr:KxYKxGKxW signal peptide domain-containing protein [Fructobacillus parabroussonetiae]MBS9337909.1 hypothetical protein [Fructobacillus parabroussonetiae]
MEDNTKLHYKMFKVGKYWPFAALLGFAGGALSTQTDVPSNGYFPLMQRSSKAAADDTSDLAAAKTKAISDLQADVDKAKNPGTINIDSSVRTVDIQDGNIEDGSPTTAIVKNDYGYKNKIDEEFNQVQQLINSATSTAKVKSLLSDGADNVSLLSKKMQALNVLDADMAFVSNGTVIAPSSSDTNINYWPELPKLIKFETSFDAGSGYQSKIQNIKSSIVDYINNYSGASSDFDVSFSKQADALYADKRNVEIRNAMRYDVMDGPDLMNAGQNMVPVDSKPTAADAQKILDKLNSIFASGEYINDSKEVDGANIPSYNPMYNSVPAKIIADFMINHNADFSLNTFGTDKDAIKQIRDKWLNIVWSSTDTNDWQITADSNTSDFNQEIAALPVLSTHHVTPSNNPDNVPNLTENVTRTIHYVDKNGQEIAGVSPRIETVTYTRGATVVDKTGEVKYDNWSTTDSQKWVEIDSPDLSDKGYETADPKTVAAQDVTANTQSVDINVTYQDKSHKVTPDNPGNTDIKELKKSVTRTINYVDTKGNKVADSVIETVNFTRDLTIDDVTGEIISASEWQPVGSSVWDAKISPDLSSKDYDSPNEKLVSSQDVNGETQNQTVTVIYPKKGETPVPTPNPTPTPNNGGNGGDNTPANNGGNVTPNADNGNDGSGSNGTSKTLPATNGASSDTQKPVEHNQNNVLPATAEETKKGNSLLLLTVGLAATTGLMLLTKSFGKKD